MDYTSLLDYVKEQGGTSVPELQKQFSIGYREARERISRLVTNGILKPDGALRYAYCAPEESEEGDQDNQDSLDDLFEDYLENLEKQREENEDSEKEEEEEEEEGEEEEEEEEDGKGLSARQMFRVRQALESESLEFCEVAGESARLGRFDPKELCKLFQLSDSRPYHIANRMERLGILWRYDEEICPLIDADEFSTMVFSEHSFPELPEERTEDKGKPWHISAIGEKILEQETECFEYMEEGFMEDEVKRTGYQYDKDDLADLAGWQRDGLLDILNECEALPKRKNEMVERLERYIALLRKLPPAKRAIPALRDLIHHLTDKRLYHIESLKHRFDKEDDEEDEGEE